LNQLAFVVWASLVPILPLFALSGLIEGPAAIAVALENFSLQSFLAVAYIAWASTLFGYATWNFLLSRHPVNRIAPFTLLVPLVGLSTGWLVFGETLKVVHLAGGALLMTGLLVNLFGARLFSRLQ
jgi:O-acetylserine/cysteine efflux transporter